MHTTSICMDVVYMIYVYIYVLFLFMCVYIHIDGYIHPNTISLGEIYRSHVRGYNEIVLDPIQVWALALSLIC